MHIYFYHIIENRGPSPYNSRRHTDNRKYFFGSLSNAKLRESGHLPLGNFILFINSNMVKPEKFDHLYLVFQVNVFKYFVISF